jgi:hypothetical protein
MTLLLFVRRERAPVADSARLDDGARKTHRRRCRIPALDATPGLCVLRYQAFHQLELVDRLLDGNPEAIRAYLEHFWSHWSGPAFELAGADLDRLVERYAQPGAFIASIG